MTQVERPRLNVRRRGIVYAFVCFDVDPHTGLIRVDPLTGAPLLRKDYVGQTRQKMSARDEQHRDDKPWSDLIVKMVELERGEWFNEELDSQEIAAIKRVRPRYNDEHNRDNPERIEIYRPSERRWVQREQRWARDDSAGLSRWVPLDQRPTAGLLEQPTRTFATPSPTRKPWPGWKQKTALWCASWLLLNITTAGGLYAWQTTIAWLPVLIVATILQVGLIVWSLAGAPLTKRERRRAKRRLPGWLR